jgi:hypothetical protein
MTKAMHSHLPGMPGINLRVQRVYGSLIYWSLVTGSREEGAFYFKNSKS